MILTTAQYGRKALIRGVKLRQKSLKLSMATFVYYVLASRRNSWEIAPAKYSLLLFKEGRVFHCNPLGD